MENNTDYVLVNAYEDIVKTNVKEMMAKSDICKCQKCYYDVCALVMNNRFSKYVTTKKGELLAKLPEMDRGQHTELVVAISIAMELVKNEPQHEG